MDSSQLCKSSNHDNIVILMGDTGVGKTHLLDKYVKRTLPRNPVPTIGVEFATKTVTLKKGENMKAHIWDTSGKQQYRRVNGAIIVYDITREETFNNVKRWIENIKEQADPDVVIVLVGNKTDLSDRVISREEGKSLADHEGIFFEETSAKQSGNINDIFEKLLEEINIVRKQSVQGIDKTIRLSQIRDNNQGKLCGC